MLYDQLIIRIQKDSRGSYQVRVIHDDLIPEGGIIENEPIDLEEVAKIRNIYDQMVKRLREQQPLRQTTTSEHNSQLWEIARELQAYPLGDTQADLSEMHRLCEDFLAHWKIPASRLLSAVDYSAMLEIGRSMSKIFPGASKDILLQSLARAQTATPERGLCVLIEVEATVQEVLDLPWEMLIIEEDEDTASASFLVFERNVVLIRQIRNLGTSRPIEIARPLASQIFVVQSIHSAPIYAQLFKDALMPLHADQPLDAWWSTEPDTLRVMRERLARYNPQLVQLVCHGRRSPGSEMTRSDMLLTYVESEKTITHRVSAHDLLQVLQAAPALQVVLLTVCDSGRGNGQVTPTPQSSDGPRTVSVSNIAHELVRGGVPMVIAMQEKISQAAAAEFSRVFYQYLQEGAPIERALAEARSALHPSRWGMAWTVPVVYRGHEQPEQLAWYQRLAERIEAAVFAPRQGKILQSWIIYFAVVMGVASSLRLPWPSRLSPDIQLLQTVGRIWLMLGLITPLFIALLLRAERRQITNPPERKLTWWAHLGGSTLGYFLGGAAMALVTPLIYLIGEFIPAPVWWLVLGAIICGSVLLGVVTARSQARMVRGNLYLYPRHYSASTWLLIAGLMIFFGGLLTEAIIPTMIPSLFELGGPSGLGFGVAGVILILFRGMQLVTKYQDDIPA
ncbi:MAG: CHAT domain-containing protein [Chloroflexi bacterium]|nr:CHAT domain-containing protein [Chloroflexota bacterium]